MQALTTWEKQFTIIENVQNKKRWHSPTNFDNVLPIITKDTNIIKLQGLLEHNDFASKPTIKTTNAMLMYMQIT